MAEHRIEVQLDRFRVVCLDCPWFHYDPGKQRKELQDRGRGHISAARPR